MLIPATCAGIRKGDGSFTGRQWQPISAKQRTKAGQAMFNALWQAGKALFETAEPDLESCPICECGTFVEHASRFPRGSAAEP